MKWFYKIIDLEADKEWQGTFDELGLAGWELFQIVDLMNPSYDVHVFRATFRKCEQYSRWGDPNTAKRD